MVVTIEANNIAKDICVLNSKGASISDRCLKGVWDVANEMGDSGYAERLRCLSIGDNGKNNGK